MRNNLFFVVSVCSILSLLFSFSSIQADVLNSYSVQGKKDPHLQSLLAKFESLSSKAESTQFGPKVGKVNAEAGCSIRIFHKDGSYDSVYFEGKMNLDGKGAELKRIENKFDGIVRSSDSTHTYLTDGVYLADIEVISTQNIPEQGSSDEVIFRIGRESEVTIIKAVQYCGC